MPDGSGGASEVAAALLVPEYVKPRPVLGLVAAGVLIADLVEALAVVNGRVVAARCVLETSAAALDDAPPC